MRKKLVSYATMIFILGSAMGVGSLLMGGAQAMTASSDNHVQPYTGGAPMSKVFYPADGSTVTVTSTGAVIKQSPGHTPYREGWVNVCDFGSIDSESDLNGRLASGSSNPYSNNCQQKQSSSTTNASANTTAAPNIYNTANANVTLAGSGTTSTTTQNASGQTTKTSSTASVQSQGNTLPNTGSGSVVAIGGLATMLGTIGHFVFQRLRYKSLAS